MKRYNNTPPSTLPSPHAPAQATNLSHQELHIIAHQSGLLIQRYNVHTQVSERFYNSLKDFGAPTVEENMPEASIQRGVVAEESQQEIRHFFDNMRKGIPLGSVEAHLNIGGGVGWYHGKYSLIYDEQGQPSHALITFLDCTEQREMRLAHEKWKSGFAVLLAESILYTEVNLSKNKVEKQEGMIVYSRLGDAAANFEAYLEYGAQQLVIPEDAEEYCQFFDRQRFLRLFYAGLTEDSVTYRIKSFDGSPRWVRANVYMTRLNSSDEVTALIAYEDIDAQQKEMEHLALKASQDPLTGVLNRSAMEENINACIGAMKEKKQGALFIIDLDNFKQVNDNYGHKKGDDVLLQTTIIIKDVFGHTAIVGRLGGDEFMVFVPAELQAFEMEFLGVQAVNALQFHLSGHINITVSASIGIALRNQNENFETLYAHADKALYKAKNKGKCQCCLADCSLLEATSITLDGNSNLPPVQYQFILEHLAGGVALAELKGPDWQEIELIYANPGFLRHLNATNTGNHKDNLLRLIDKDDLPGLLASIRKTALSGENAEYVYRINSQENNGITWRFSQITSLPSTRQDVKMVIGMVSDITSLISEKNLGQIRLLK